MNRQTSQWFKAAAASGMILAVLLIVETLFTYHYSATRFSRDQGLLQAVEEVSALEHQLRREQVGTENDLRRALAQIREDRGDEIAWVSVLDANGEVQASSGSVGRRSTTPPDRIHALLERGESYSAIEETEQGKVLVALLAIRPQVQQNWRLAEIAIYLRGPEGILHPLRRNLLITALAAIALLISMFVFWFRLQAYVRGRTLENQLQLARSVQQRLLPENGSVHGIEFAGECLPADEVGGDFYDVFLTESGEIVLVLADVSGKGLPAALRMGVVHGAIRALCHGNKSQSVARMAANLNELMREKASREFTTLFWAYYNPERHDLRYVNAGHLPPLLVVSTSGEVRRLETGGPVLGLLPKAVYQEECVRLNGEQTLIIYSDGLAEATSPIGEDFGESRLLSVVRASSRQTACTVLRRVMDEAIRFVEGGEFHDDLTVLVAKLVQTESKGRRI
jgi:hypothetical protein